MCDVWNHCTFYRLLRSHPFSLLWALVSCTELLSYGGLSDSAACWFSKSAIMHFTLMLYMKKKHRHRHLGAISQQRILHNPPYFRKLLLVPWFSMDLVSHECFHSFFSVCKDFFQIGYTLNFHAMVQECSTSSAFSSLFSFALHYSLYRKLLSCSELDLFYELF